MNTARIQLMALVAVVILLTVTTCSLLQAATLNVRVAEQDAAGTGVSGGIAGATVCYAQQNGSAKDRKTTDNQGNVSFPNVPQGSLLVAVFRSGYISKTLTFNMPANDNFQQIALVAGNGPAAVCPDTAVTAIAGELSTILAYGNTNPNDIHAAGKIQYQVTARNTTGSGVANVRVEVSFPTGFSNLSGAGGGFTCAVVHTTVLRCNAPQLAVNNPQTISMIAFAPPTVTGNSDVFTIRAEIDPANTIVESNEGNNISQINTTVLPKGVDLTVDLAGSDTAVTGGQIAKYQVTVKNIGDRPTSAAVDFDATLPPGVTFANSPFPNCSAGQNLVRCNVGVMAAGATLSNPVNCNVPPNAQDGPITFRVDVDNQHHIAELLENNNSSTTTTTISATRPDFFVSGATSRSFACLAGIGCRLCGVNGFIIEGNVHNDGHASGSGKVTVLLPSGLSMYEPADQQCPPSAPVLSPENCGMSCTPKPSPSLNFSSLAPGATHHFFFYVRESNVISGSYHVTFTIDSNQSEEDVSNNSTNLTVD
jgi:uncharacterized repeat protein (TIGR01451 family)